MRLVTEPRILETKPLTDHVWGEDQGCLRLVVQSGRPERRCLGVERDDRVTVDIKLANLELDRDLGAGALEHAEPPLLS